jgi:hypothetical protein
MTSNKINANQSSGMYQACDAIAPLATARAGRSLILSAAQGIPRHWAAEP